MSSGCGGEASRHQADHRPLDHRDTGGGQPLVVAVQPPTFGDPRQGSLHHPAPWQHLEGTLSLGLAHDLKDDPYRGLGLRCELAGVPAVGPYEADRRERLLHRSEHGASTVTVLDTCRCDQHDHQQADRVDHDMALAPIDLLARVIPARRAANRVCALDRLRVDDRSGRAGVGRPSVCLTALRNWSCSSSSEPSSRQRTKCQYTVSHGGKSFGNWRHEQPVRNKYRIALTTSRRG